MWCGVAAPNLQFTNFDSIGRVPPLSGKWFTIDMDTNTSEVHKHKNPLTVN